MNSGALNSAVVVAGVGGVLVAAMAVKKACGWATAAAAWSARMETLHVELLQRADWTATSTGATAHSTAAAAASGAAIAQSTAAIQASAERAKDALVNLERRAMNRNLTGAECGRLLVTILEEWDPHGAYHTWRWAHARRKVLEQQGIWVRACNNQGLQPTQQLWDLIVEGAYSRAAEELEASYVNSHHEVIRLQDKIAFWRSNIEEARGTAGARNLLEEQQRLQVAEPGLQADVVLYADLVPWRQYDLLQFRQTFPDLSPTEVPPPEAEDDDEESTEAPDLEQGAEVQLQD